MKSHTKFGIEDCDFAIEEARTLEALARSIRQRLELMRAHQDFARNLNDAGSGATAAGFVRDEYTQAENSYHAAKSMARHIPGVLTALEANMRVTEHEV